MPAPARAPEAEGPGVRVAALAALAAPAETGIGVSERSPTRNAFRAALSPSVIRRLLLFRVSDGGADNVVTRW